MALPTTFSSSSSSVIFLQVLVYQLYDYYYDNVMNIVINLFYLIAQKQKVMVASIIWFFYMLLSVPVQTKIRKIKILCILQTF